MENNIALKVFLLELLININKVYVKSKIITFEHPSEQHKRIAEIATYLNNNYMSDIGLEVVARKFFVSSAHLSRLFKKITGFSFIEYLQSIRIKEAEKLLAEKKLSISEISEKVGYQNITSFGRVFKSINGISPMQYRKLL